MKRAAIYARYSSDLQSDRSIEDQVAICRGYAQAQDLTVIAVYSDRAASGASMHGRPDLSAMMTAAKARAFDVVIAESMSRIGRDQEDRAAIRKRLNFVGVTVMTPADGVVTPLVDGIKAVIDSQYLEDLKHATRRGMAGAVREGRHAGGRAYGYRNVAGQPGILQIDEDEAAIVRRIFAEYIGGKTPRDIAKGLNADGIAAPRGSRWNASTINGNAARGNGIILNDLYRGRIVWNKLRMVKDPDTGKRISRPNDPKDFKIADAPQLRIVDDVTADKARQIKAHKSIGHASQARRAPRVLSGLLRCGVCGGGMTSTHDRHGKRRLECSATRENGSCKNTRRAALDMIERRVLAGLQERLTDTDLLVAYVEEYNKERHRLAGRIEADRSHLEKQGAQIERELKRAADAIVKGVVDPETMRSTIADLQRRRDDTARKLAEAADAAKVITLHPAAIERYRTAIENLALALDQGVDGERDDLKAALRELIEAVLIHPTENGFEIEIRGRLATLTDSKAFPHRSRLAGSMVAGGRCGQSRFPGTFVVQLRAA